MGPLEDARGVGTAPDFPREAESGGEGSQQQDPTMPAPLQGDEIIPVSHPPLGRASRVSLAEPPVLSKRQRESSNHRTFRLARPRDQLPQHPGFLSGR